MGWKKVVEGKKIDPEERNSLFYFLLQKVHSWFLLLLAGSHFDNRKMLPKTFVVGNGRVK
jgi:hypothetical protein